MNLRNFLFAATAALTLAAASGCDGGGDSGNTGGSTGGTSDGGAGATSNGGAGGSGGSAAMMPTLGAQIDRMGRPAINTATNQTFNINPEQADAGKDGYNANKDPSSWANAYVGEMEKNLAILDGLDTVCGNQLGADMAKNDPTRYQTLATVLSDDRLYVNTEGAACTTYLAVEANATGLKPNMDCGGRRLSYDVIDVSYTVLATGDLDMITLGDDIPISDSAKGETFPHLDTPH